MAAIAFTTLLQVSEARIASQGYLPRIKVGLMPPENDHADLYALVGKLEEESRERLTAASNEVTRILAESSQRIRNQTPRSVGLAQVEQRGSTSKTDDAVLVKISAATETSDTAEVMKAYEEAVHALTEQYEAFYKHLGNDVVPNFVSTFEESLTSSMAGYSLADRVGASGGVVVDAETMWPSVESIVGSSLSKIKQENDMQLFKVLNAELDYRNEMSSISEIYRSSKPTYSLMDATSIYKADSHAPHTPNTVTVDFTMQPRSNKLEDPTADQTKTVLTEVRNVVSKPLDIDSLKQLIMLLDKPGSASIARETGLVKILSESIQSSNDSEFCRLGGIAISRLTNIPSVIETTDAAGSNADVWITLPPPALYH